MLILINYKNNRLCDIYEESHMNHCYLLLVSTVKTVKNTLNTMIIVMFLL